MRLLATAVLSAAVLLVPAGSAPAVAGSRVEKDLPLEPGGRLSVDVESMAVRVTGSDESGAHVVVESSEDLASLWDLELRSEGGEVTVRARRHRTGWSWFGSLFGSRSGEVTVRVPGRVETSVATSGGEISIEGLRAAARLDTSGGSVSVTDHEGDVDVDTSGGNIRIESVRGDARVETSGGSIRAREVGGTLAAFTSGGSIRVTGVGGDLTAETSGGSIEVDGAGGAVVADTSGGSISVALLPGNDRGGTIETSGGSIAVRLDPAVDLSVEAHAGSGIDVDDLPLTIRGAIHRNRLEGNLGQGGRTLTLRCSGGSIRIAPLGP